MKPFYPSLTAVLHATVLHAPSGLDAATMASMLGRNYSTLMADLKRHDQHKLDADLLLPIIELSGSSEPMKFLARETGGVYFRIPASEASNPVHRQCMASVAYFGELMRETSAALEDGVLTRDERDSIIRAGHEALSSIAALLSVVDRESEK